MNDDEARKRDNRRLAIGLALFAAALFASVMVQQWMAGK